MRNDLIHQLQEFIENEARSGSMDFGCITPLYVYRMWGGSVAIEEIATGLMELRKTGTHMVHGSWTSQAAKPSEGLMVHG